MRQIQEDGEGLAEDLVGFFPLDVDHKAHSAGIVFKSRVIKALSRRQSARILGLTLVHFESPPLQKKYPNTASCTATSLLGYNIKRGV